MQKRSSLILITLLLMIIALLSGCGQNNAPSVPMTTGSPVSSPTPQLSSSTAPQTVQETLPRIEIPVEDTPVINQSESLVNSDVFVALSSEALEGRVMGSLGSEKAQDMINDLFSAMELEPFGESYNNPIFMNQSPRAPSSVVVTYEDQTINTLIALQDYFIAPGRAFSGQYRVVYREQTTGDEKVIFIVDEDNTLEVSSKKDQAVGYIYRKSSLFQSVQRGPVNDLHLFLSEDIMARLKQSDGKAMLSVNVPEARSIKTIEGSNIVGRLEGENSTECIVISAHYDGDDSKTAALDNASGTYTLLRTAEKLSEYSNFNKLGRDIIFALFDGEEQGLVGSGYLAEKIKNRYEHAMMINIDCVGLKDSDSYMAVGDSLKFPALVDSLYQLLESNEFGTVPVNVYYASDHLSFEWQDIPAATIGERDVDGIIHTNNDVAANIDLDELERLCDAIFAYVLEYR